MIHIRQIAISLLMTISCFSLEVIGSGVWYGHPTTDRMNDRIEHYLAISTNEVAQRAGTDRDVAMAFKREMLTDPVDGEEISEERKNKKCMQQIRIILKKGEDSGTKLELVEFKENTSIALDNKEKALILTRDGLASRKSMLLNVVLVGGLLAMAGARASKDNKTAGALTGGLGATMVVGGGIGLCFVGAESPFNTHINQIQTMKNDWEISF